LLDFPLRQRRLDLEDLIVGTDELQPRTALSASVRPCVVKSTSSTHIGRPGRRWPKERYPSPQRTARKCPLHLPVGWPKKRTHS
jgi:hypothetical protein